MNISNRRTKLFEGDHSTPFSRQTFQYSSLFSIFYFGWRLSLDSLWGCKREQILITFTWKKSFTWKSNEKSIHRDTQTFSGLILSQHLTSTASQCRRSGHISMRLTDWIFNESLDWCVLRQRLEVSAASISENCATWYPPGISIRWSFLYLDIFNQFMMWIYCIEILFMSIVFRLSKSFASTLVIMYILDPSSHFPEEMVQGDLRGFVEGYRSRIHSFLSILLSSFG